MNIGNKFATLRTDKGVSVYKLAKDTDVTESYIHTIEKGENHPSVKILSTLLSALGVTLSEFFNESENVVYVSPTELELLQNFRSLGTEEATTLLQMTKLLNK